ncbi:ubiquitin carboxyl-terminal hydrolase 20-like [Solanum pennellii]|uniref:Ubiquitin carboxyl-terminal hydrolase n=1 Tax=Solanum pennellii TaxID=28526 RepID=A0ABM1UW71_SOLPN|nr:ubiquitin carboxyl-terminal hydrolase 20-like [Solanum pennellii]
MGKNISENLTSPNHQTIKFDEIEGKNINFSSVKTEVEEEEKNEKYLGLFEGSPDRIESAQTIVTSADSNSIGYIVSSDRSGYSYSDGDKWSPLKGEPSSLIGAICSSELENFEKIVAEESKLIEYKPFNITGIGMCNLGNTCFLNVIVQSFMHTVVLLQLLRSIDHVSPCLTYDYEFCVVCIIRELIDISIFYGRFFVWPTKIVSQLRNFSSHFNVNKQEDAHEFLQCFLNKLEICCNYLDTKENIVKEAFGGRLVSKLRCCNCGYSSITREPLIDLSLEIEDVDSVSAAMESFTKIEKIEFSCERCKTQGPFEKQLLVDHSPNVVVLHLKRFKYNGLVVQKVEKHVSFSLELDMLLYSNDINNEEIKYDLYAVIVHSGPSISSGHYYNFIRCAPNEWYKFDDEKVDYVQEDLVLAEQAYILFYTKRGTAWFSDYIQSHRPFVCLVNPTTTNDANDPTLMPEVNNVEDNDSHVLTDQVYCEDQLQDVKIKQDEKLKDALNCGSHGTSVNEMKRKLKD